MTISNSNSSEEINLLLNKWSKGNRKIENQLVDILYPDIHRIAHFQIKSNSSNALQTTEIVNEAFIKLSSQKTVNWQNKDHFLAIAAKVIRRVIVDHYRTEFRQKRGGAEVKITLDRVSELIPHANDEIFAWSELDDLLNNLSSIDAEAAQVVEYKIFGGMSIPEMSAVMSLSESTVSRNWKFAKSWLIRQYETQMK